MPRPLLSIVASIAWWCGDGARAGVAVDHALELEPDHSLSRLVRDALDHGVRPRQVRLTAGLRPRRRWVGVHVVDRPISARGGLAYGWSRS